MCDIIGYLYSISCDISVIWNVASTRINEMYDYYVRCPGEIEKELGLGRTLKGSNARDLTSMCVDGEAHCFSIPSPDHDHEPCAY